MRLAFAATIFGDSSEALFWLQLRRAVNHLISKSRSKPSQKKPASELGSHVDEATLLTRITSYGKSLPGSERRESLVGHVL